MPSDHVKPSKKPSGERAAQSRTFSSPFRKRQASEASTASSQGWSGTESTGESSSATDYGRKHPSRSTTHYAESSVSSAGEDGGSYSSRTHVRLVNPRRPAESASNILGMDAPVMSTVMEAPEPLVRSPDTMSPRSSTPPRPAVPSRPSTPTRPSYDQLRTTPPPSRTTTPIPSTSRVHWNQLRNHFVPGSSTSSAPPPVPNANFPQSAIAVAPPRPQTPKPSRLARLGFRQVVEHTREVVQDEASKFEAEVYKACASARFGEVGHKAEREGSQGGYLPFMSTTSLPLSATTTASQPGRSAQSNEVTGRSAPSLQRLHDVLFTYAPSSSQTRTIVSLPYESEVLSVLLIPFMAYSEEPGMREHWLSVETFEIATKSWRPSSHQREIDRILWCCKAALIPASSVRSRILGTLSTLLHSTTPLQDGNPLALQNILQGLQLLLHEFSKDSRSSENDSQTIRDLCVRVSGGDCGQLGKQEIEQEYEVEWGAHDSEESIRSQIVVEGVVRCMQSGSESLRRWILEESVETYWTLPPHSSSLLSKKIMGRRLSAFLRASLSLLRLDTAQAHHHLLESDSTVVIRLLQERALPELEQLPVPKHMNDARALVVELLMELLTANVRHRQEVVGLICRWCEDLTGWKESLDTGLRLFVERAEWPHLTRILQDVIREIPDEARKKLASIMFLALYMRLVVDPAPYPLPGLTSLLRWLVQLHPEQFYKPLFSLAAASKDPTIVGQLGIVTALARHLPEFWIRDPEMVSVALMSDIGGAIGKGKAKEGDPIAWGKTRIGQSLIMLELIRSVKQFTKDKKDPSSPPDASQTQAHRFVIGLEARLAILLDAKEKSLLVPFSQRILLSVLLLEIRLFTRSLKPAPWLPRIVTWTAQSYLGATLESEENPFSDHDGVSRPIVKDDVFDEVMSTVSKIQSIYVACWQSPLPNARQRSTMILSPSFDPRSSMVGFLDQPEVNATAIKAHEELLASLSTGVASATLRLLVAVCGIVTQTEHRILGPVVWSHLLDETDPHIVAPACFILTHCLEKSPKDITKHIEIDIRSSESAIRRAVVRRLMTLFAWRSQLLSQSYIYDRARRRPFKLARQPIGFVAIDVGSGNYVHEQTEEDRKNHPGGTLPFELRKRLAEVGWEQDDQPTDTRQERVTAPISLFPASQLDHLTTPPEQALSPARSAESVKQLLRRKSSSSGHHPGAKRRPVFVPALVSLFSSVALLATDLDTVVASDAREAILLMLRDDPAMLCRPVMETLSGDLVQVGSAISVLRAFLHIHHRLPPSASHHIFSHLGGFLKHISRDSDNPKALRAFSYTVPLLAKLITQVSNLSIRDLRRSKFEIFVFPSGSLWFPSTAPPSSMFPQTLGPMLNPFEELPPQMVGILMVRTAQNMLLLDMLKHKPQEVHVIRKSLTGLVLPGQNTGKDLDASSFVPRRPSSDRPPPVGFRQASLALSRSHLLLLGQVFRSMSRNFNGKAELARLFDGINRIMLAHGDDIGIVTHALIACMVAVTRFKRLVSSSGGFALFMPSLLKVYAEAESHAGIRHAIQYASSRFYAIHQEAYLFQSLDLASNILVRLDRSEDQDWLARHMYQLFSALKAPPHRSVPDAAGIRGANRTEEREALIATTVTDETPRTGAQDSPRGEQLKKILALGQYESKLLQMDDLVRLFLTVIAHDPTVMRAQNFLALFRRIVPEFYNASNSARSVLRDGINALGTALFVKTPRQKVHENVQVRPLQHGSIEVFSHESNDSFGLFDDPASPCDHMIVRREYLNLILAFSRMGGDLRHGTVKRALDLVKSLLKEPARPQPESESAFLHELTDTSLSRLSVTPKQAISLLHDIAPVIRAFALSIDCSGVLQTVTELLKRPDLANDGTFIHLVVEQIAGPMLEACGDAASENLLLSLPMRPAVVSLVSHAAGLRNTTIASIIEKQTPSPGFLAGVLLPLCLTIKTSGEIASENHWQGHGQAANQGHVFVRLLAYAMDACHAHGGGETGRSSPLPPLNRRDSQRSKRSSLSASRTPLATLTVVVQIIKIIITRAADDLSSGLVGIWARLARFLQQLLDDGDARFALLSVSSPAPSPWQSPKLGPSPSDAHRRNHSLSSDNHPPLSPSSTLAAPRVVDYLTWSLMEYLCCVPSPLTLQMRLWMQERVHSLDTDLKALEPASPLVGPGSRSRRLSSSVFARPRRSSVSPDALRASRGLSSTPSELNLSASTSTDLAAYSRFSNSPTHGSSLQPSWSGPRIIHLGPTKDNHPMFHTMERSSSQDSNLKNLARTTHVGLQPLVRSTYGRIRIVQTCMGYDRLLPMDGRGGDSSEMNLKAWTKASALTSIVSETKELMEEFRENFYENVGGDFVDVPSGLGFGSTQNSPVKGSRA